MQYKYADYVNFAIRDFICDEHFQNWIWHNNEETNLFWEKWLAAHPDKEEIIHQSKAILTSLQFKEDFPSEDTIAKSLEKIFQLPGEEKNEKRFVLSKMIFSKAAAAVLVGLLGLVAVYFYYSSNIKMLELATKYGEMKTVVLSDSSVVTLNADSKITYPDKWRKGEPREVWLDGEAFFNVKRQGGIAGGQSKPERFIIHTENLAVEVLGTSFDVKRRKGIAEVVLNTGIIRVSFKHSNKNDIILNPGDKIRYDYINDSLTVSQTDPVVYSAWKDGKLSLGDVSVREILDFIEEHYGYKAIVENKNIESKKMEGVLFLENLDDVLFAMSAALDIKIEKKDSTIILR